MQQSAFAKPLFYYQQHRVALTIILILLLLQFIGFKLLYPHPNFMPDSYGYLESARNNEVVSTWPTGYSRFLKLLSVFSRNDVVLVLIQYFFLQGCILYFLFGAAHVLQLKKGWLYFLAFLFTLNPTALLISNYVASDALFIGGSLLWFCLMVQLLVKPERWMVWALVTVLFLLFIVRYNAIYYPIITGGVLLLTRLDRKVRLKGLGLMMLVLGLFVGQNLWEYKKLTGTAQFSPFGGWMLGGNALFMYSRLPRDTATPPRQFARMHQLVNHHLDSLDTVKHRPDSMMGIYYIWRGPQRAYMDKKFQGDTISSELKRWATMAPFNQAYASWLIRKYPMGYAKYFMLPNAGYYFVPPGEFLDVYNQGRDSVQRVARIWFGYPNGYVKNFSKHLTVTGYVAALNTLFNILFLGGLLGFLLLNGHKASAGSATLNRCLVLVTVVWGGNFVFSVSLAPIVFRYQLMAMVLSAFFGCVLMNLLYRMSKDEAANRTSVSHLQPA